MTGIFRANNPSNTFWLFFYGLLLKLPAFLQPVVPQAQQIDGFLYKALLRWLQPAGSSMPVIYPLITWLLLFTQAVTFNRLVSEQRLMQRPSFLPGMSYMLLTSLFPAWNSLSAPLIINTLLIWVWARMSNLHNQANPKTTLFNIGAVIGTCTFFYFPAVAFSVLIVAGLAITRPFRLPEWITALLGMITPWYFLLAYVFLSDKIRGYRFPGIAITAPRFSNTRWEYAACGIVVFLFLAGVYFIQKNYRKQLIQSRKSWNLIFLYLLVAVFVPFISAGSSLAYWILCAIPLAAIAATVFFYPQKKLFPLLLHWGIAGFIVAAHLLAGR